MFAAINSLVKCTTCSKRHHNNITLSTLSQRQQKLDTTRNQRRSSQRGPNVILVTYSNTDATSKHDVLKTSSRRKQQCQNANTQCFKRLLSLRFSSRCQHIEDFVTIWEGDGAATKTTTTTTKEERILWWLKSGDWNDSSFSYVFWEVVPIDYSYNRTRVFKNVILMRSTVFRWCATCSKHYNAVNILLTSSYSPSIAFLLKTSSAKSAGIATTSQSPNKRVQNTITLRSTLWRQYTFWKRRHNINAQRSCVHVQPALSQGTSQSPNKRVQNTITMPSTMWRQYTF